MIYYGRHHDLVDRYRLPASEITIYMVRLSQSQSDPLLIHIAGFVTRVARRLAQELLRPFWSI